MKLLSISKVLLIQVVVILLLLMTSITVCMAENKKQAIGTCWCGIDYAFCDVGYGTCTDETDCKKDCGGEYD